MPKSASRSGRVAAAAALLRRSRCCGGRAWRAARAEGSVGACLAILLPQDRADPESRPAHRPAGIRSDQSLCSAYSLRQSPPSAAALPAPPTLAKHRASPAAHRLLTAVGTIDRAISQRCAQSGLVAQVRMGSNHTGFCRVLDDGGEEMHFGCVESMVRPARRRRRPPPPVRFHSARRRPPVCRS